MLEYREAKLKDRKQQRGREGGARLKRSEEVYCRITCRSSHQLNVLSVKKQNTNKKQRVQYLMQRRKIGHDHDMHDMVRWCDATYPI